MSGPLWTVTRVDPHGDVWASKHVLTRQLALDYWRAWLNECKRGTTLRLTRGKRLIAEFVA